MKNKIKKSLVMLLAAAMFVGSLAGCGNSDSEAADDTPVVEDESSDTEEPADDASAELEEVTLRWYIFENSAQADVEAVEEAIYEYLKGDLNVRVDFITSDAGSYPDKVQMAISSGETFDLCFTSNWLNDYVSNASKNAYWELEDLLAEYGQELYDSMPEAGWEAAKVNGKIYGVPNQQIWARTFALEVGTEYLNTYNFDLAAVTKLEELEPLLEQIKADNPDMYPIAMCMPVAALSNFTPYMNQEILISDTVPVGYDYSDPENAKVVNLIDTDAYESLVKLMYDWNQKGYISPEAATYSEWPSLFTTGKSCVKWCTGYNPGAAVTEGAQAGMDLTLQPLGSGYLATTGITATMTSISRTSENPERAMMFLNRLNTDPVLYNLVTRGIEDVHYTNENGYAIPIENAGYDLAALDWAYGNVFNGLLMEGYPEDVWEGTMEVNNTAIASDLLGFALDTSNLQTEIAAVASAVEEYATILQTGCGNPDELLPQLREKMDAAGMETIVEEVQRQVDEFLASK